MDRRDGGTNARSPCRTTSAAGTVTLGRRQTGSRNRNVAIPLVGSRRGLRRKHLPGLRARESRRCPRCRAREGASSRPGLEDQGLSSPHSCAWLQLAGGRNYGPVTV
jgi:hypothetical protein